MDCSRAERAGGSSRLYIKHVSPWFPHLSRCVLVVARKFLGWSYSAARTDVVLDVFRRRGPPAF